MDLRNVFSIELNDTKEGNRSFEAFNEGRIITDDQLKAYINGNLTNDVKILNFKNKYKKNNYFNQISLDQVLKSVLVKNFLIWNLLKMLEGK